MSTNCVSPEIVKLACSLIEIAKNNPVKQNIYSQITSNLIGSIDRIDLNTQKKSFLKGQALASETLFQQGETNAALWHIDLLLKRLARKH